MTERAAPRAALSVLRNVRAAPYFPAAGCGSARTTLAWSGGHHGRHGSATEEDHGGLRRLGRRAPGARPGRRPLAGYGSTLTVVSVAADGGRYQPGPLDLAREQLVRRQVSATYLQPVGEPAAELVEAARELDADPPILGRRSRSLRRLVLGSVSARVVRQAPCDVLVVR